MSTLYRITVKTTGSLQPGRGQTFWSKEVVYCGYDRDEAVMAYRANETADHGGTGSYGNRCRETVAEELDADAEDAFTAQMESADMD